MREIITRLNVKNWWRNNYSSNSGLIARRIVCEVDKGQKLEQGERIGMIRFGSRVDIYFKNKKTLAKIGQNVVAGESLIASV